MTTTTHTPTPRKRMYTAPHPDVRCTADRKPMSDGSGARCMRKRVPGSVFCSVHKNATNGCQP